MTRPPVNFLDIPQPCRECGEPTVTKKVGPLMRQPLHLGCDKRLVTDVLEPDELVDVLALLSNELGPLRANPPASPARAFEIGPCVRCRRPTRRYGWHGSCYCHHCDEKVSPLNDQLSLFPLASCKCGHVIPALEPGEPCPTCMADREEPHDCALHLLDEKEDAR